ncbi:flavin-containing monooxygenase [Roseinatronobacter alkalisoli]|uniref:NAD(P)-binding domain-containing protein n=1 Tax=Roseinatronobacter alkalisoli TaxID=3028235 RepID=A0ABT5TED7_9RHOB|nr:NAD(P)-binding domain-containing protein [Roseinatronobacter sp. HJB301]MDD7973463.1 NAD(P)-binding domain-containing protein [Roseinatronobacter sp. HJB301]
MTETLPDVDVLVVGGAQAGLAAGYYLAKTEHSFLIVDRHNRVGDSWRSRYDSLTLFTPRALSALPGLLLDGDPEGYPARDEFAGYLETYASHFGLPVLSGNGVTRLERRTDERFVAQLDDGRHIASKAVIVATGAFQKIIIPSVGADFGPAVRQLTPESYRNATDAPTGTVLVVGDGASGRDIAAELSRSHDVVLAVGRSRRLFPEHILGKSTWWWLRKLGMLRVRPDTTMGRLMRRTDPFPDRGRSLARLRQMGVTVSARLVSAHGRLAFFADESRGTIDSVIWCTGYRDDSTWLQIPGSTHSDGTFLQKAGLSPIEGLFYLGRPWQRNRASALVMGVGEDASALVPLCVKYCSDRHLSMV